MSTFVNIQENTNIFRAGDAVKDYAGNVMIVLRPLCKLTDFKEEPKRYDCMYLCTDPVDGVYIWETVIKKDSELSHYPCEITITCN